MKSALGGGWAAWSATPHERAGVGGGSVASVGALRPADSPREESGHSSAAGPDLGGASVGGFRGLI
eukprot:1763825-Alexandrium_andersonii.AAC.1